MWWPWDLSNIPAWCCSRISVWRRRGSWSSGQEWESTASDWTTFSRQTEANWNVVNATSSLSCLLKEWDTAWCEDFLPSRSDETRLVCCAVLPQMAHSAALLGLNGRLNDMLYYYYYYSIVYLEWCILVRNKTLWTSAISNVLLKLNNVYFSESLQYYNFLRNGG